MSPKSTLPLTPSHPPTHIQIIGARHHELKNIHLNLPHYQLIVITGISGSGKSSLVFDVLYAEGHRRHMETLEIAYARNFMDALVRPNVDQIHGLQSVIGIKQEAGTRNPRSTVGTVTEIHALLRLLFARTAVAYSYASGKKMVKQSDEQIETQIFKQFASQKIKLLAPLIKGRKGHYQALLRQLYKQGFREVRINGHMHKLPTSRQLDRYKTHDIEVLITTLQVDPADKQPIRKALHTALYEGKGTIMVQTQDNHIHYFSRTLMDPTTGISYKEPSPNTFSFNSQYGACPACQGLGTLTTLNVPTMIPDPSVSIRKGGIIPLGPYRDTGIFKQIALFLQMHNYTLDTPIQAIAADVLDKLLHGNAKERGLIDFLVKRPTSKKALIHHFTHTQKCPDCDGQRLQKEALHFKIDGKNIADLSLMDLQTLSHWFKDLETRLDKRQNHIAQDLLKEIRSRLALLLHIGLHYLHLYRSLQTLSGGEIQRIRLAAQIGSQLVGVLYILDEPSIGLHQRDNQKLITSLQALRDMGNTVLVIEHDKDTMLQADYLVDIGPLAGKHGGKVVAAGTLQQFLQQKSITADFLKGTQKIALPQERRPGNGHHILLQGCSGHNLKDITLKLPLGKLIAITGVSGSGKSTLIHHTLFPVLNQHFKLLTPNPLPYQHVQGLAHVDKVIAINQAPIGRTPRSNPATYTKLFSLVRNLFVQLPEAKIRGYKPGRFSFNVKGGRCETCQGAGIRLIEMDFLPSVRIPCQTCKECRYNRETLAIKYKGKSIADILDMTVETALVFFEKYPQIGHKLQALNQVGLGYLTLGRHATTLSGGEAQRVKLASELARKDTGKTLYILDEPTTGLHFQDIQQLLSVLQKLVDKGNTVLIIEHNLDVIKVADHVIDLGPEAGEQGGQIIAQGTPEEVAMHKKSHTALFLRKELAGTSSYNTQDKDYS